MLIIIVLFQEISFPTGEQLEFPEGERGGGGQTKKPFGGELCIFSGTTHWDLGK